MVLFALACAPTAEDVPGDAALRLSWYRSDEAESWAVARAGLDWALSQAGALPPADGSAIEVLDEEEDRVRFELHVDRLELAEDANAMLVEVGDELRSAGGSGGDDLGRFLLRGLHEPWRYYVLTGACGSLEEWRAARPPLPLEYAVTTSLLLPDHRLVRLPSTQGAADAVAFEAVEGEGSLADGSFGATSFETVDLMPNGQFRYAVYDLTGALQAAGDAEETGLPANCAWCHEASVHAGTPANESAPGYLSYTEWMQHREGAQATVEALRASLDTSISYDTPAVHGDAERLVEGFLFPDTARVASEWRSTESEVRATLGEGTLTIEEFGWTRRYSREVVDAAAPEPGALPTLRSARHLEAGDEPQPAGAPACR